MNDLLVLVIVVAVVANVALIVGAIVYGRTRGQSERGTVSMGSSGPIAAVAGVPPSDDARSARIPSISPPVERPTEATDPVHVPAEPDPWFPEEPTDLPEETPEMDEPSAPGLHDPDTGLTTAAGWDQILSLEESRYGRYGRPATVVAIELDRLADLADHLGDEAADRLIPAVADTIRRSSRSADVVARTGHATFQVLMPETDEIRAINFVERVRESCDTWLEASAVAVRLAVGWASAGPVADLRTAARVAVERMYADRSRGRPAPGRPPAAPR